MLIGVPFARVLTIWWELVQLYETSYVSLGEYEEKLGMQYIKVSRSALQLRLLWALCIIEFRSSCCGSRSLLKHNTTTIIIHSANNGINR